MDLTLEAMARYDEAVPLLRGIEQRFPPQRYAPSQQELRELFDEWSRTLPDSYRARGTDKEIAAILDVVSHHLFLKGITVGLIKDSHRIGRDIPHATLENHPYLVNQWIQVARSLCPSGAAIHLDLDNHVQAFMRKNIDTILLSYPTYGGVVSFVQETHGSLLQQHAGMLFARALAAEVLERSSIHRDGEGLDPNVVRRLRQQLPEIERACSAAFLVPGFWESFKEEVERLHLSEARTFDTFQSMSHCLRVFGLERTFRQLCEADHQLDKLILPEIETLGEAFVMLSQQSALEVLHKRLVKTLGSDPQTRFDFAAALENIDRYVGDQTKFGHALMCFGHVPNGKSSSQIGALTSPTSLFMSRYLPSTWGHVRRALDDALGDNVRPFLEELQNRFPDAQQRENVIDLLASIYNISPRFMDPDRHHEFVSAAVNDLQKDFGQYVATSLRANGLNPAAQQSGLSRTH